MIPPRFAQFLQDLPKAELHLHLEGSVPAHRAAELSKRAKIPIPGLIQDPSFPSGYRYHIPDFKSFIDVYIALSACLQNETLILDLIDAVGERLQGDNVCYAEITFTPLTICRAGVPEDELLNALLHGRQKLLESRNVEIQWVFDFVRSIPGDAMATVDLALKARHMGVGVAAFGVGGPESPSLKAGPLAPAFEKAKAEALPAVPHAGEQTGAWAVWEALDSFYARRIGHGIRSVEDPGLMDRLRDERICLEICPSSNIQLVHVPSFSEHPVKRLDEHGIPFCLATDDPGLLNTRLFAEYAGCAEAFEWGPEKMAEIARNGVLYSLASEECKGGLLKRQDALLHAFMQAAMPGPGI